MNGPYSPWHPSDYPTLPRKVEDLEREVSDVKNIAREAVRISNETRRWTRRTALGVLAMVVQGLGALTMILLEKLL